MAKFGEALRAIRQKVPMSCSQLARKMGWSDVYQRDVELGRVYPPNISRIKDYARHLGVDPLELIKLVIIDNKFIRLQINSDIKIQFHTATALLTRWDTLTNEQLLQIEGIVTGRAVTFEERHVE